MLVLSRKRGQRIIIRDEIVIQVVEIARGKVRIGIECPKEIPVHREEVQQAIKAAARGEAHGPTGFQIEDLCDADD